MKTKLSIALIFVVLIFAGCYFKPSGENFEELDQTGNPPYVEVELNFDSDTLYIWNNEWLYFSYKQNGDKVKWARFIIDGQETSPNDEQHGALELLWYFPGFTPGKHSLSMQLFTDSGTGSIADKTGVEGYLMQKDWVLIITDDFGVRSDIIDTTFENGLMKVSWKEYKGLNFESYKVYKWVQPSALPDPLVATITDQHQTSVFDPDYHGENSAYYVLINGRYRGKSLQVEGPLPQVNAVNNAKGDIVLHWEKPPFWAALKGYRVLDNEISWSGTEVTPLSLINNPQTDSLIVPDPYFGYYYDLWLQLDPKNNAYFENWSHPVLLASRVSAVYGPVSPKFEWAKSGTGKKIFLGTYSGVSIFDTENLTTTIKSDLPVIPRFEVSSGNNYLAGLIHNSTAIFLYNIEHPENSKTIDLSGQLPDIGHLVSVSDNGTGIVISGTKAVLVDFISEKVIAETQLDNTGLYRNHMSGDGRFFTLDTYTGYSWYSCSGNEIKELETIKAKEPGTIFSDFMPDEQTQVVVAADDHVSVYDCSTQKLLNRWNFKTGIEVDVFHVVKSDGALFLREGEELVLLNLETGKRTVIGKTRSSGYMNKWSLIYNNGQVLWTEGRRLDVTQKLN